MTFSYPLPPVPKSELPTALPSHWYPLLSSSRAPSLWVSPSFLPSPTKPSELPHPLHACLPTASHSLLYHTRALPVLQAIVPAISSAWNAHALTPLTDQFLLNPVASPGPATVTHTCNLYNLGGEIGWVMVQADPEKLLMRPPPISVNMVEHGGVSL